MEKKQYHSPEISAEKLSFEDILNGSDVLIDAAPLFGTDSE